MADVPGEGEDKERVEGMGPLRLFGQRPVFWYVQVVKGGLLTQQYTTMTNLEFRSIQPSAESGPPGEPRRPVER